MTRRGRRAAAQGREHRTRRGTLASEVTVKVEGEGLRHQPDTKEERALVVRTRGFLARTFSSENAVARRRAVPIMAYVGHNGSGKTACMIRDTLPSLERGRLVYSTVTLLGPDGEPHPLWRPFSWEALLHEEHADFLLDEVIGVASSRESSSMSPEVQNRLNQLRKADIVLRWSAPAWARADKIIREVTQAVTECRGYMSDSSAVKDTGGVDTAHLWAPRRLFRLRTYDMVTFDEWTAGKRDSVTTDVSEWWWGAGSAAFESYRTLDAVQRVPPHDPSLCPVCGKKSRVEYCKGHE